MTALVVVALVLVIMVAVMLLEKRPGYGVYYGLAKLTGAPLDIGPVDWQTLARHATPNDALVCPAGRCPNARADREAKAYAMPPGDLLARLKGIALAEPDTKELDCAPHCDRAARFVQYSRLMRFPDTIDVAVFPAADGVTLAIYSRSLIGRKDFGVNCARVRRWLAALDSS